MYSWSKKYAPGFALASLVCLAGACQVPPGAANNNEAANSNRSDRNANGERSLFNSNSDAAGDAARQPTIEVEPAERGADGYRLVPEEKVTFTVRAPEAREVELLYEPVYAADRFLRLKTLTETSDRFTGGYEVQITPPADFDGEVWARVHYENGDTKQTERLRVATRDAAQTNQTAQNNSQADSHGGEGTATGSAANISSSNTSPNRNPSPERAAALGANESAREDLATGGKVRTAALKPGAGGVRVTVNVPAFKLTLWQNGREVATYLVGVGRKEFPIPIGERTANKIILNPAWIPPDSEWVRASSSVEPYERIPADDPQNPLGKIKIPLGDAYLLHEAESPADLGNLVSHGCVRVLRDDLFDLTRKLAEARGLKDAENKIDAARGDSERRVIDLGEPLEVDINYDTMTVEGGILRLYPDVYGRDANTVERLRAQLGRYKVDAAKLDDETLRQMLDRVTDERFFAVPLAALKSGQALARGKLEPLTPQQAEGGDGSERRKS